MKEFVGGRPNRAAALFDLWREEARMRLVGRCAIALPAFRLRRACGFGFGEMFF